MSKKKRGLKRHGDEEQKQYEREARLQYGPAEVNETIGRWNSFSKAEQEAIIAEGDQIYIEFAAGDGGRFGAPPMRKRGSSSSAGSGICVISMSRASTGCAAWGGSTIRIPISAPISSAFIRSCQPIWSASSKTTLTSWRRPSWSGCWRKTRRWRGGADGSRGSAPNPAPAAAKACNCRGDSVSRP